MKSAAISGQAVYILLYRTNHGLQRGAVPGLGTSNVAFKDFRICRIGVLIHGVRGSSLGFGVPLQECEFELPAYLRVAQAAPAEALKQMRKRNF
jgi:hypothetical protein